jgi:predicted PurR-regulated permease PerM
MSSRPPEPPASPNGPPREERVPKGWLHLVALAGLTLVGLYFCYRLTEPFLPALAWALALAIIAHPMHTRLAKVIPGRDWAAAVSTAVVVAVIVVPGLAVAAQLANEAALGEQKAREVVQGGMRDAVRQVPFLDNLVTRVEQHVNPELEARKLVASLTQGITGFVQGSVWGLIQALIMVFVLYFAFRDQDHLLAGLRRLLPVTRQESEHLFTRTSDAVHATVYATIVTGLLQGVTGGLLFWALGVPAPLLWGVVMTVLSIIPIVGAFIVWVPVAVVLAVDGRWGAAALIVTWGVLMAGPVCNWVYAYVAGGRLRLHPVPALLAFVGGLTVFGVSGMVLGPVILAVTLALVEMWQRRAGSTATPVEGRSAAVPEYATG